MYSINYDIMFIKNVFGPTKRSPPFPSFPSLPMIILQSDFMYMLLRVAGFNILQLFCLISKIKSSNERKAKNCSPPLPSTPLPDHEQEIDIWTKKSTDTRWSTSENNSYINLLSFFLLLLFLQLAFYIKIPLRYHIVPSVTGQFSYTLFS